MTVVDDRFEGWFATIELEPGSSRIASLRDAVESLARSPTPRDLLALATYAVGLESRDAFGAVQRAISAHHPPFSAAPDDLEPRLVASAVLATLLERGGRSGEVVAGAVLSAEFGGHRTPVDELPQLARGALINRLRRVEPAPPPSADLARAIEELERHEGVGAPGDLRTLARELSRAHRRLEERVERRLDLADEELDVLWWAFGRAGGDDVRSWGSLGESAATLLRTGIELASLHRFAAEVPSALEITRRILGPPSATEHIVAEIVAAAAEQVKFDPAPASALLPITTSCSEFLALREGEDLRFDSEDGGWSARVARIGIDPTVVRRGDEITVQTLREVLLARAVN